MSNSGVEIFSPFCSGLENAKEQSVSKKLSELKPYKSLLLARVQSSVPVKDIVDNLLEDLRDLLSLGEDGPRTLISEVMKSTQVSWPLVICTTQKRHRLPGH